ncbi:VCBS repeat-containing protein [Dactylosporangium vinaceum]|uniref:FG-GAP-like repeat-containing protein n=1 Tax=Dactylosporangium vinaceum TaxID=53362 RepID=A0ABV5M2B6_9ACTN|nr:FG-GAP-like repeat-containing protein [Dactylosporangium vinaceum]UAB96213.1 VCBS repeat-containing protein [Dactylosporangium vinaceum]
MGVILSMLLRRSVAVACLLGVAALNPSGSPAAAAPAADHKLTLQHLPKPDRSHEYKDAQFDPHAVLVQFKPDASAANTDRAVKSRNAHLAGTVAGTRYAKVTTPGSATDLLRDLGKDPSVAGVSLDYRRTASTTPNDPGYTYGDQDYLKTVRLPQAWDRSMGGADQVIAVVDSGVDGSHPDLGGRTVGGYNAIAKTTTAASANTDDYGHGTMVAGIAAANTNNGDGIAGAAWNARIMSVKVLDSQGHGFDSDIAAGIVWAADHGAKIINLSLGGPGDATVLHDAVTYATNKGSLLVVAAGNTGGNAPQYPAAYPEVLTVAATDWAAKLVDFSSWGDWVDVAAPGLSIVSTYPGQRYAVGDGTSFAAPIVSGVAALMRANNPALTPAQLIATIKATARDSGPRGLDPYYGAGVLDAYAATGGPWAAEFAQPSLGAGEPNDVPARATSVTTTATGTFGIEGDVDWYRFDPTGERTVTVTVTPPAFDANRGQNMDTVLAVYDKDLKLVGQADSPDPAVAEQVTLTVGAGAYYVAVRNYNGAADDRPYTVAIADAPSTQFQPAQSTATGSWAQTVAIGDVTGDGRNDVVLATTYYFDEINDYKLFVYAQNANGTFAAPAKYSTRLAYGNIAGLAVLDTNGDGRKDVAVGTAAGVQIFRQTSTGTLSDTGLVAGTEGASRLATGDLDGDGDADLVVTDTAGITLLTQGAGGAFTASSVSAEGGLELEVGDVDGDGRNDVVGFIGTTVNVYHNTTTGWTRTNHETIHGDDFAPIAGIEVADVTGDNKADIIATVGYNPPSARVNVFKQNASGGLDTPAVYLIPADSPGPVEAADVNGDGRLDVVTVHGGTQLSVLRQNTDGTLAPAVFSPVPYATRLDAQGLALGDIDGDNRIDAVMANYNSGLVVLRAGTGPTPGGAQAAVRATGIADFATGVALDAKPTVTFARVVDTSKVKLLNGATGQVVPAAVSYNSGTATATVTPSAALLDNTPYRLVVEGEFSSTFRTVDTAPAAVTNLQANGTTAVVSWTAPAVTDLDQVIVRAAAGATAPDSVTAGFGLYAGTGTSFTAANLKPGVAYTVRAFTRDRSGKVTAGPSVSLTVNAYKLKVDFNGDGNTDVAGIDANSDIKLYKGDGTGKLVGNDGYMWPAGGLWNGFKHIVAADFNGDGKVDIAGIDANNDIKLYTGDGAGKLVGNGSYMWPTGGLWGGFKKIVAGDFNNDGKVDIAGIDAFSDLKLYTGDGTGKLVGNGSYMWPTGGLWNSFKHIEAADFNTDGKTDVTGIDANNDIKYYTGDGTGKLVGTGAAMWPTGGLWAGFKWIVAGDFNNDGKADIAGIDANNDIKYYTGDGTGKLVGNGFPMWPQGGLWVGFKQLT